MGHNLCLVIIFAVEYTDTVNIITVWTQRGDDILHSASLVHPEYYVRRWAVGGKDDSFVSYTFDCIVPSFF